MTISSCRWAAVSAALLLSSACTQTATIVSPATHQELFVRAWALGANDLWIVGASGTTGVIAHWDGVALRRIDAPEVRAIVPTGVWASSAQNVWVSGQTADQHGVVIRFDGSRWTTEVSTSSLGLLGGVWGASPNDIWAVGFTGATPTSEWRSTALHYDGSTWTTHATPTAVFNFAPTVHGIASNDVWMQVDSPAGQPVLHWDGAVWSLAPSAIAGAWAVWPAGNELWVSGPGTLLRRWNRTDAPVTIDRGDRDMGPIWAAAADDVWMLSGRCVEHSLLGGCTRSIRFAARWNRGAWSEVTLDPSAQMQSLVGTSGGAVWFVGDGIQRYP